MPKQIVIELPDWVDNDLEREIKKILTTKIREEIERDYVDMKHYRLYFALKFPETGNTNFDLQEELKKLGEIRDKGRKRVK